MTHTLMTLMIFCDHQLDLHRARIFVWRLCMCLVILLHLSTKLAQSIIPFSVGPLRVAFYKQSITNDVS